MALVSGVIALGKLGVRLDTYLQEDLKGNGRGFESRCHHHIVLDYNQKYTHVMGVKGAEEDP